MGLLKPLKHKAFKWLALGQVISDLGDWFDFLAITTLVVYRWELGAGALAALSVTMMLPSILLGPVAGVWADRWPRRTVMIVCDLGRCIVVAAMFWAPNLPVVLTLVVIKGAFSTFFNPARQSAVRLTVPEEDLLAASSLSQFSVQTGKVVGPALGGLLVAAFNPHIAFLIDSASFLISALCIAQMPMLPRPAPSHEEATAGGFVREFLAGIRIIRERPALRLAILSISAALFLIFTFDSLTGLALKALGLDEKLMGIALGSIGLGAAAGAIVIGQWAQKVAPLRLMGASKFAAGALVACVGTAVWIGPSGPGFMYIPLWLFLGVASAGIFIPYSLLLQVETPKELVGRVTASASAFQTACHLLGPLVGAALSVQFGVGAVFAAGGTGLLLLGAAILLSQGRKPKVVASV